VDKIGKLIGPGGKNIKRIQEETGAQIDIEDDGTVYISSVDGAAAEKARDIVEAMTAEVKVGRIYNGKVVSIKEFGAFVEIAPETDGLVHVSELSNNYIKNVGDVVRIGDEIKVKVILIDDQGRIKLSRKAAMRELGETEPEPVHASAEDPGDEGQSRTHPRGGGDEHRDGGRGGRSDHGGRGGHRGGHRGERGGERGGHGGGGGESTPRFDQ